MYELPPAAVYAVIGVLAAIENVFPPVPSDMAVAIGAFVAHEGTVRLHWVVLVAWIANVVVAAGIYWLARWLGRDFFNGRIGRRLVTPRALAVIERLYVRHGTVGIFLSRFVFGVRAIVPPFAGVVGLSAPRALLPMIVASGIWYAVLVYAVYLATQRIDDLAKVVSGLNLAALVAALLLGGGLGVYLWRRHRRSRFDEQSAP